MRNSRIIVMSAALLLAFVGTTVAQTADQNVSVDVDAINVISVSGDPASLVISTATAGSQPDDASNNLTTWAITTNELTKKVVGSLDVLYQSGVSLKVTLASTAGTSAGQVTLSLTDQDLVTGLSEVVQSGEQISYVASATVEADAAVAESHVVTFTITS